MLVIIDKDVKEKPISRQKLLADIEHFCDKNNINKSELGAKLFNDTAFYTKIKNGRSPTLERIEKFYAYIVDINQLDLFK